MRILCGLFLILIFSCKQRLSDHSLKTFEFYPPISDTSAYKKEFIKERIESDNVFNLPDLFNGSKDSFEIRIWPWEAFDWFKDVFIFRLDSNGWKGFHYNSMTTPLMDYDGHLIKFTNRTGIGDSVFVVKKIIPKCGWKKFDDSLIFFQIPSLPNQNLINNFKYIGHTDGYGYNFEIATPLSYRYLYYDIPDDYQYKECKLIAGFVEMLKRQLGSDYNWPRLWLSSKK